MNQVFISYRHVSPAQEFAYFLADYLKRCGLAVFVDTHLIIGDRWVEQIEAHIKSAQFFVALLSAESIRSDMVRQEVEFAHQLRYVKILPVRIAFEGALPYDLASYRHIHLLVFGYPHI